MSDKSIYNQQISPVFPTPDVKQMKYLIKQAKEIQLEKEKRAIKLALTENKRKAERENLFTYEQQLRKAKHGLQIAMEENQKRICNGEIVTRQYFHLVDGYTEYIETAFTHHVSSLGYSILFDFDTKAVYLSWD